MSILDKIERAIFGASAAEAVEMRVKLAEQHIEREIIEALEHDSDWEEKQERESQSESEQDTEKGA
ncbi:MAG TPA: hypothetical protein VFU63_04490 [Ktedonobacterales bacterium]|nr:hypothetical protein [Ktedonobacterales bacterium]